MGLSLCPLYPNLEPSFRAGSGKLPDLIKTSLTNEHVCSDIMFRNVCISTFVLATVE
ncbi:hypothetical protein DAI22_11g087300 [Oryza sativa Japonica Group]|nr:hypothetical protein DAI22_11g087300 [Oryza sativa Japonica Group]